MTKYLSIKIRNLSAISILMVVYIHMYYTEGLSMPLLAGIERFIGGGLCSIAVPLFYMISGYLFFWKVPNGLHSIGEKLKKRCRTLLLPYIIANTLTFVFYITLSLLAMRVPSIDSVVNFNVLNLIETLGIGGLLKFVFIDPPVAFQLWFLRDLMVVMLLSPAIYLIFKKLTTGWGNLILLALAICFVLFKTFPLVTAFVWFSAGSIVAMQKINIDYRPSKSIAATVFVLYIIMCIFNAIGYNSIGGYIPLIGIPAIWMAYDIVTKHCSMSSVDWLTRCSFFIYLIHEPLLNIFKKLPLLIDRSEPMLIACYILIPPVFYVFGCILSRLLKRVIPNAYSIYTGGR